MSLSRRTNLFVTRCYPFSVSCTDYKHPILTHSSSSDLAKFIAADRIPCTIDRVSGIIETNRPDDKNKQYADVVKQGDALITKLQKYGQAVRLRGSERG